jgi:hypothetical protein
VVAINTEGVDEPLYAIWTAGTVLPNSRVYRLRMQYRIGIEGPFEDVLTDNNVVEYERNEDPGHSTDFVNIQLPEQALNQPYVQFLWRYYYSGEQVVPESGQRAMLRLDDIVIGTADFVLTDNRDALSAVEIFPNPFIDRFTIEHEFGADTRVALFGADGRRVYDGILGEGMNDIVVSDLASGFYVLRLSKGGEVLASRKIVVMER